MDERSSSSPEPDDHLALFTEPADFRPPTPPPTKASYRLPVAPFSTIELTLVGSHPLWAHHLWNASPTLSDYLCKEKPELCRGKSVLELGAAAGLPSLVAHILGAAKVVTTDYPDAQLTENLQKNVDDNIGQEGRAGCVVEGFKWGSSVAGLKAHLPGIDDSFDLLLLSDLIFNHQAHGAMLDTMDACLPAATGAEMDGAQKGPQALVFFTHHRPHLADRDMSFFHQARYRGWTCKEVGQWKMAVSGAVLAA